MDQVALDSDLRCDALVIPGTALEKCLREANESQIKIYLYLLKNGTKSPTVSSIADYFNYSEQDVKRALRFWNVRGAASKASSGGNVVEFSGRESYSKEKIARFMEQGDVRPILFAAEQYMGRPIKPDEISSILYIYDELKFPADLVEYLLEYCISNNKKNFRSIESVATEWKEAGVSTLDAARKLTKHVPKEMRAVMDALGFPKDRQPVEAEIAYVRRWTERYGYGMDIIGEACARTVLSTGKPSIRYANSILKGWHDAKVKKPEDILAVDEEFHKKKIKENTSASKKGESKKQSAGKFNNFTGRKYDYDSLMKDIL
ncbi:MAG: DnaD domain protein [Lachnospiraceae bacterium]|nr:DnaD domain protein [Lachnospiraceae bacterium]